MKKFDERLKRLEELSQKIREPEIGLEEAMAIFEEGIKLSKGLEKDISRMEAKVEILLNEPSAPDQKLELTLFNDEV